MIYFFIGIARSGKSTLAKQWQEFHGDIENHKMVPRNRVYEALLENPRVVICADQIRLALSGDRFNSLTEDYVHGIKHTMVRAFHNMGYDVLIDGTHTTVFSISKVFSIEPCAEYCFVDTPKHICIERAINTGQPDLQPVITRMAAQKDYLTIDKIEQLRPKVAPQLHKV